MLTTQSKDRRRPGSVSPATARSLEEGLAPLKAVLPRTGTAEVFSMVNGFGNIQGDDGIRYFIHQSQIRTNLTNLGFRALPRGQRVTFLPTTDQQGRPQATACELVGWQERSMASEEDVGTWSADEKGKLKICLEAPEGYVSGNVSPALIYDETALFYTGQDTKALIFTLPETADVAAIALDKDKNRVRFDEVPFGGFIVTARRHKSGSIDILVNRFGKRYDKPRGGIGTNLIVVEKRLEIFGLKRDSSAEEVGKKISADHEGELLLDYHLQFIESILTAISRLKD